MTESKEMKFTIYFCPIMLRSCMLHAFTTYVTWGASEFVNKIIRQRVDEFVMKFVPVLTNSSQHQLFFVHMNI
jgi:hypothetical protein